MKVLADTAGHLPVTKGQNSGSLRERKHERVLREIERAAWELFATVGFDGATVEAISQEAGISRRTFFRYFQSKEDLFSYSITQCGRRIVSRFAAQPMRQAPLSALERAILDTAREEMGKPQQPRERIAVMMTAPPLRGRFLYHLNEWAPLLAEELLRRRAYRGNRSRCELAAALYCTAFDSAHMCWLKAPGTDLLTLLKGAFRQLGKMKGSGQGAERNRASRL